MQPPTPSAPPPSQSSSGKKGGKGKKSSKGAAGNSSATAKFERDYADMIEEAEYSVIVTTDSKESLE